MSQFEYQSSMLIRLRNIAVEVKWLHTDETTPTGRAYRVGRVEMVVECRLRWGGAVGVVTAA